MVFVYVFHRRLCAMEETSRQLAQIFCIFLGEEIMLRTHRFSVRTYIMYYARETSEILQNIILVCLSVVVWSIIYGIYYSSGVKMMLEKDATWEEQMRVIT